MTNKKNNSPYSTPELDAKGWLSAVIESSDDAIITKTLDGIVTTWNAAAHRIFGYSADEMIGQAILKIIPNDRRQEETMILDRLRRGERVDHFETVRQRKDGAAIDVSVTISPIRNSTGRIIGVSKIARDVTLQKRLYKELSAAKEAAEAAKKISEEASRAKDNFLGVLSHELRTPLTPVLAIAGMMEKDPDISELHRKNVAMIRRNIETEARLVDDLLDVTRISRGKITLHFEAVDAHAVVRNVIAMFERDIDEKALAITILLRAKEHYAWADAGRFQQILLNLISNAVKFSSHGGAISIKSSDDPGGFLRIEIIDDGVGIDSDVLPRLFNAFEQGEKTTNRRFGGLGLGLSIVKSLIDLHKGRVTVVSTGTGKGSTFTIEIPFAPSAKLEAQAVGPLRSAHTLKGRNILLVEDHVDTREMMCLLLRSFGCRVSTAGSVKEAIEAANHETFDVLLCDFGLPDGTGADVVRQVHLKQRVKAIAMTGFGQDEDIRRSREAGFSLHLTKPVPMELLEEALGEVV